METSFKFVKSSILDILKNECPPLTCLSSRSGFFCKLFVYSEMSTVIMCHILSNNLPCKDSNSMAFTAFSVWTAVQNSKTILLFVMGTLHNYVYFSHFMQFFLSIYWGGRGMPPGPVGTPGVSRFLRS